MRFSTVLPALALSSAVVATPNPLYGKDKHLTLPQLTHHQHHHHGQTSAAGSVPASVSGMPAASFASAMPYASAVPYVSGAAPLAGSYVSGASMPTASASSGSYGKREALHQLDARTNAEVHHVVARQLDGLNQMMGVMNSLQSLMTDDNVNSMSNMIQAGAQLMTPSFVNQTQSMMSTFSQILPMLPQLFEALMQAHESAMGAAGGDQAAC